MIKMVSGSRSNIAGILLEISLAKVKQNDTELAVMMPYCPFIAGSSIWTMIAVAAHKMLMTALEMWDPMYAQLQL